MSTESGRQARADVVWYRIEQLSETLAEKLAIAGWLRPMLQSKEAEIVFLKEQIERLHVERNAIFHEDDE